MGTPADRASELASLTRQIAELPPLPRAMAEAVRLMADDDLSPRACIEAITYDQALAVRILRLANSAFYGAPGHVGTVSDAVRLLGLRTVTGVLSVVAMQTVLKGWHCEAFDFENYWRHSVGVAVAAKELALRGGVDGELAFVAGLMHDVGQVAMALCQPELAQETWQRARSSDQPALEVERALWSSGHDVLGSDIARHWRFPLDIVEAIACHHLPHRAPRGPAALGQIVHVADAIAHGLDLNGDKCEAVPNVDSAAWVQWAPEHDDMLLLLAKVESHAKVLAEA